MLRFEVALAELGTEALQRLDLLGGKLERAFGGRLLQAQQALMFGQQSVALLDAAHAGG